MDPSQSFLELAASQAEDKELGIPGEPQVEHQMSSYQITVVESAMYFSWGEGKNPKVSTRYEVPC